MYLKSLQISGFKSFAKKTTLEFSRGITAIVGPNGSGKSNIADSVRWVMGEQSIKSLRGKKSEDVIFSGSDKKTRLGLAEVSLELDNSDNQIPLDYSEILIGRRIYRSGESDYLINNAKCKLADINLLLTKANFGHRTYSVIGQGMIDNFLIATPQERKEFFEEATGVKQYQIKKKQALSKLEHVWQNLSTLKIKISEMEPQLRLLSRHVKKLKKRKEIKSNLDEARLKYYSSCWQEIDKNYLDKKTKIDRLNSDKDKIYSVWKNLEDKLNNLTKNSSFNSQLDKLRQQEQQLLNQKIELKEKLLTLRVKQTSLTAPISAKNISKNELGRINEKIKEINQRHKKLIDLIDRQNSPELLKKEIISINKKIDNLLDFLKPFVNPIKTEKIPPHNNTNNIEQQNIEGHISEINQKITQTQNDIKKLQAKDSQERSDLWQLQKKFQDSQSQLNQINAIINEQRVSLARLETKHFSLRSEIKYELGALENLSPNNEPPLSEQEKITLQNKINRLKNQLEIIGGIDPEIEAEYQSAKERYDFLSSQSEDLSRTSQSLKKLITQLDDIIKHQVNKSFTQINKHFQKYFKILFGGGKAELSLVKNKDSKEYQPDKDNPALNFFQEKNKNSDFSGIEVSATPPGKKLKSINVLSGGERALTSIALICAIISSNPSPFVILDEVDASLDEANSIRFIDILESLSHKTQFIVITHNRATMEHAALLYGVTMGDDGVSKLLSIKLNEAKKYEQ